MLEGVDLKAFWRESEYANRNYVDNPLTPDKVALVESRLGHKLPAAYVALMQSQNGGFPTRTVHRTTVPTSWADDHVAITGFYSIGDSKPCSLCGQFGSQFWVDEWGYPPIGVYFADSPSAGHDMLCLDYRECGPKGEPAVVHVDQEFDYKVTFLAPSFEAFIGGLDGEEALDAG
jgi:hypothetical protein